MEHPPNQQKSTGTILRTSVKQKSKRNKRALKIIKLQKLNIHGRTGKCTPCLSGARTLCYNQMMTTNTFTS